MLLTGELTIERAEEIKGLLIQAIGGKSAVSIDLSGVTEVDLSALQLLCAACKSCKELNKTLEVKGIDTPVFRQLAEDAGVSSPDCCANYHSNCLWCGGD